MTGSILPSGGSGHSGASSRVVRMIVINWIGGAVIGALTAAALLWLDIAGIGSLVSRTSNAAAAIALLFGGFALTFASLVAGTAIMLIPKEDKPRDPPGGHGAVTGELAPARVIAR